MQPPSMGFKLVMSEDKASEVTTKPQSQPLVVRLI